MENDLVACLPVQAPLSFLPSISVQGCESDSVPVPQLFVPGGESAVNPTAPAPALESVQIADVHECTSERSGHVKPVVLTT